MMPRANCVPVMLGGPAVQHSGMFVGVGRARGLSPQVWIDVAGHRVHLFSGLAGYSVIGKSSGAPKDTTATSDPGWR